MQTRLCFQLNPSVDLEFRIRSSGYRFHSLGIVSALHLRLANGGKKIIRRKPMAFMVNTPVLYT